MKVYGQLEVAQAENLSADPSNTPSARVWFNTTANKLKTYFSAAVRVFVFEDTTQTLTNKTLTSPTINTPALTVLDADLTIQDNADNTKQLKIQASGITTGTTRTLTAPDADTTIVGHNAAQVITNKDIDGGTAANTRRITVPSDTKANLDALTRKAGTVVYATDHAKFYGDNGTTLGAIGGGAFTVSASTSLAAGGTISLTANENLHIVRVGSSGGEVALSSTPFGTTPPANGTYIVLVGTSDDDYPTITANDAADGCVGNFSTIALTAHVTAKFIYLSTPDRYIYVG